MKLLIINPGATSTKIAVFEDEEQLFKVTIDHSAEELDRFPRVIDQAGLPQGGHSQGRHRGRFISCPTCRRLRPRRSVPGHSLRAPTPSTTRSWPT